MTEMAETHIELNQFPVPRVGPRHSTVYKIIWPYLQEAEPPRPTAPCVCPCLLLNKPITKSSIKSKIDGKMPAPRTVVAILRSKSQDHNIS